MDDLELQTVGIVKECRVVAREVRVLLRLALHLDALRPHLASITDPTRRAIVERALERYDRFVAPALPTMRAQVIHNDLTLDNLLLDGGNFNSTMG